MLLLVPLLQFFFEGEKSLETYASLASAFVCHVHPGNSRTRASYTPGKEYYRSRDRINCMMNLLPQESDSSGNIYIADE